MEIVVSSKILASKLKEIDFNNEQIEIIYLFKDEFILHTEERRLTIPCQVIEFESKLYQYGRRWDAVKSLVSNVEEQPITLRIFENVVKVVFDY